MFIRRRFIMPVVISLVLGVVSTIAVAWGLALGVPQKNWDIADFDSTINSAPNAEPQTALTEYSTFGSARREWRGLYPGLNMFLAGPSLSIRIELPTSLRTTRITTLNDWGTAPALAPRFNTEKFHGVEHANGFPFLCLWYSIVDVQYPNGPGGHPVVRVAGGISIYQAVVPGHNAIDLGILPLRPIWRGLLLNMAIYAAAWFVVLWSVAVVRRQIRVSRALCVGCRYPRQGLAVEAPCPECGHTARPQPLPPG